jgi:hypothetical protein
MKKLLYLIFIGLVLSACEIRHNHDKQVMQVRVPVDSTHHKDVKNAEEDWQDEPLIETPTEYNGEVEMTEDEALEELDRMMTGAAE